MSSQNLEVQTPLTLRLACEFVYVGICVPEFLQGLPKIFMMEDPKGFLFWRTCIIDDDEFRHTSSYRIL